MDKITAARGKELHSLKLYSIYQAFSMVVWEVVPALVGASAFIMHTYLLGKGDETVVSMRLSSLFCFIITGRTLTPAMGFTSLALFNLLRGPLMMFPEIINFAVRGTISMQRIQCFLDSGDVKGLPLRTAGGGSNSSGFSFIGAAIPSRVERSDSASSTRSNSSGLGPAR